MGPSLTGCWVYAFVLLSHVVAMAHVMMSLVCCLQVLPFYSSSLGEEEAAQATSAYTEPPSEALAQVYIVD